MMRERIKHRDYINKDTISKNFWEEFKQRGFKVDPNNDGCYHREIRQAAFATKEDKSAEIIYDDKNRFNIVSAQTFMKTVSQIEGLVKYKLFK